MSKTKSVQGKPVIRTGYLEPAKPGAKPAPLPDPFNALEDPAVTALKQQAPTNEAGLLDIDAMLADTSDRPILSNGVAQLTEIKPIPDRVWSSESRLGSLRESAVLFNGGTLPQLPIKEGANPNVVKALNFLEKILCAGVIVPWAMLAYEEATMLVSEFRKEVCVNADATPGTSEKDLPSR